MSVYNHETFSMYRDQNKKNIDMFYLHTYSNLHTLTSNKLLWECAGGSSKEVIYPGRRYWCV